MNAFTEGLVTIALAIVGLGIVSVLVSKNSQTSSVIQAGGSAFGNSLAVAEAPVTGAGLSVQLGYPASQGYTSGFGF